MQEKHQTNPQFLIFDFLVIRGNCMKYTEYKQKLITADIPENLAVIIANMYVQGKAECLFGHNQFPAEDNWKALKLMINGFTCQHLLKTEKNMNK